MGPSSRPPSRPSLLSVNFFGVAVVGLLLTNAPAWAQSLPVVPGPSPAAESQGLLSSGTVSGTVLDVTGAPVSGATVRLTRPAPAPVLETTTEADGRFSFSRVSPGPYDLTLAIAGFKTKSVSATLPESQGQLLPAITLELAPVVTDVSVQLTTEEIATEQIKLQEQQMLLGVIPNFYTSYIMDAAPMNAKQKFGLAWKLAIDPSSFVIAAMIAGGGQAANSLPGYGQGAAGYFNRLGAAYGDFFIGTYIGNAILPSLLHQDPRYFYKGTGSVKSRILWALERSVVARGDNGHLQPDYSGILGSLASGAISNLYYPSGSQHGFSTTLNNTLIGIGTGAGVNLLQEFVFPKITPKLPKKDHPKS